MKYYEQLEITPRHEKDILDYYLHGGQSPAPLDREFADGSVIMISFGNGSDDPFMMASLFGPENSDFELVAEMRPDIWRCPESVEGIWEFQEPLDDTYTLEVIIAGKPEPDLLFSTADCVSTYSVQGAANSDGMINVVTYLEHF